MRYAALFTAATKRAVMLSEPTHLLVSQAMEENSRFCSLLGGSERRHQSLRAARNILDSSYREIDLPTWGHSVVFRSLGSVTLSLGALVERRSARRRAVRNREHEPFR
jgi:hypothetical protein